MKNIELQIAEYDNKDNCRMHYFKIKESWLKEAIKKIGFSTIEEFMEIYTSDESSSIYDMALLENEIIEEYFG